jgi:Uma2 family endonuclease
MSVLTITEPKSSPGTWRISAELRQQLLEALAAPARPKMTYEEFLNWADEDTLAEWVNGEVVMTSPASDQHQDISDFLVALLRPFVEQRRLGVVRSAPFQMKLPDSGREPDLSFVAAQRIDRLRNTYLDGPADLAIEVLSPESLSRDRGAKFYEYAQGGVLEYWLIDPLRKWAEFYRLGQLGLYEPIFSGREGIFHSEVVLGFWLRVEWLWQEPLPNSLRVLGEIAGIAPQIVEQFIQALGGG